MTLTPEARLWRTKGIGGSDARTIAIGDADDWLILKREKIDGIEPVFSKQQRFLMDLGSAVERVTLEYFSANVRPLGTMDLRIMMKADPYFRCTLDGVTNTGTPVQCKFHTGDKNTEDLAEFYWAQLQHEMLVADTRTLFFAVAFGHYGRFDSMEIAADHGWQSEYMLRALQFKEFCWGDGSLPGDMALTVVKPSPPRLRDHVWHEGDNQIAVLADLWLNNENASMVFNEAAKAIKELVPEDCRSALWQRAGKGIKVTVNKAGSKSIKAHGRPR